MKAVAREAVYRMLKEVCVEAKKASYKRYKDAEGNANPSIPPLRDKAPEIDWGRLHWHADCIVAERDILGEYWADLAEWACDNYAENALTVWRALCGRFDKAGNRLKKWRCWKKRKKLGFDCSVLFKNGAEALGEMTLREGDEDDLSNYMELTGEDPTGVRTAPSSRMRESTESEPRVEPHVDEVGEPKPDIPPDKPLGVKADFGDSCLTEERRGLTVVVIAANVYFSAETELDDGRRFSVNPDLLRASWCVLFVGFISHTWRWYEASAGERTPAKVAKDGYAAWLNLLEEQEQARRLSDAFWRLDGCDPHQKRPVVETLSERRSRQTAERLKRRAVDEKELARRGRQASVGEDVTCGFGTRVLGTVDCSGDSSVAAELANQLVDEDVSDSLW